MPVVNLKGGRNVAFNIAKFEGIKQSRTALNLWTWLDKDNEGRDFDVVVLADTDNFGQMLTESDQSGPDAERGRLRALEALGRKTIERPVVLWNPSYAFPYYGDVKGVTFNSSGDTKAEPTKSTEGYYYQYKSGIATLEARVIRVTKSQMPAWIVLYHELGHVKQYFDCGGADGWERRLSDTSSIEAENLTKHENPICVETNRAIRAHYKHSIYGFNDLIQQYSFGKKANAWKESDNRNERAALEKELEREANQSAKDKPETGIYLGIQ